MRTADAVPILKAVCGKPFKELFEGHPADLTTNKGHAGQLLEKFLGIGLGSALIDFEDGELKTNKTAATGEPLETIAVTQISGTIDDMLADPPPAFALTRLCKKLNNLVVVPIVKTGQCEAWYCLDVYHIDLDAKPALRIQFEDDYLAICAAIRAEVQAGGEIHTTNGRYLQVRSKDYRDKWGNYQPIYSERFGRYLSDKNHAFYLQKEFVRDIIKGKLA
jgi:DNA mismatch repair protein MutH